MSLLTMSLLETFILFIATVGVLFMLVSAIGILRLPDIFARMHAAGKAATLGVSCLLLASGLYFGTQWFWRSVLLILLFFITAPIATTTMARAAYRSHLSQRFVLEYDDMAHDNGLGKPAQEMEISRTTSTTT